MIIWLAVSQRYFRQNSPQWPNNFATMKQILYLLCSCSNLDGQYQSFSIRWFLILYIHMEFDNFCSTLDILLHICFIVSQIPIHDLFQRSTTVPWIIWLASSWWKLVPPVQRYPTQNHKSSHDVLILLTWRGFTEVLNWFLTHLFQGQSESIDILRGVRRDLPLITWICERRIYTTWSVDMTIYGCWWGYIGVRNPRNPSTQEGTYATIDRQVRPYHATAGYRWLQMLVLLPSKSLCIPW